MEIQFIIVAYYFIGLSIINVVIWLFLLYFFRSFKVFHFLVTFFNPLFLGKVIDDLKDARYDQLRSKYRHLDRDLFWSRKASHLTIKEVIKLKEKCKELEVKRNWSKVEEKTLKMEEQFHKDVKQLAKKAKGE